jgi:glucose uptake protein GlcU
VGCLLLTPLVNLYFLNLPVQGAALSLLDYFKTTVKQHLLGAAGGAMWAGGAVAFYAAASMTGASAPKVLQVQGAGYGSAVVAAVCGLVIWGEQKAAPKAKGMLFGTAVLVGVGAVMLYLGA